MRLLVDCMPLGRGGGMQVAVAFLSGLTSRADFDWHVMLPERMVDELPADLRRAIAERVIPLPKKGPIDIMLSAWRQRKIERKLAPDIVFSVFGPAYFRARARHLVGFAMGLLIYDGDQLLPRANWRSRFVARMRRFALRRSDHVVVETAVVAYRLARWLGISDDRISVIGNAVNPLLARQSPSPLPTECSILVPSAYYPHKNLEVVPAVVRAMLECAPQSDVVIRLTLPTEHPGWRGIIAEAERLGVADRVMTLGNLDVFELAAAYRAHRFILLPTLCESSTAVYPEAFHFRRPVVTSDADFAHELCGQAAAFVPSRNASAIADTILALHRDPRRITKLILAGQQRLATAYPTPEEKFDQQIALIYKVAQVGRKG